MLGLDPMLPMCCVTVPRMLLPAAQLAHTPNLLVLPHTRVFCCCAWNSMQYMNSPYASACGRIEAPYPDGACLVCYLDDPCYSSSLIRPRFSVFGVRFSGPDSGPRCCFLGPWPVFWARFWGLFFGVFFRFFGLNICNAGICLEGVCEGCCQVSPAGGWCAWAARPCLGFTLRIRVCGGRYSAR